MISTVYIFSINLNVYFENKKRKSKKKDLWNVSTFIIIQEYFKTTKLFKYERILVWAWHDDADI